MLVGEALNTDIGILSTGDAVSAALKRMDELEVDKLPVINPSTNEVAGQIKRSDLRAETCRGCLLSSLEMEKPVVIFNNQHLFHAVKLILQHNIGLLPVVDEQAAFLGIIQKKQLLELLVNMLNLTGYGSIITVELSRYNFALAEIVQLIEAEGGKIMGITVESPNAEHEDYEISFKLNLQDVSSIAAALRRYGYIIFTETKNRTQNIDLAMRADEFLQYLDM
jgi:CBS domain-containing protein